MKKFTIFKSLTVFMLVLASLVFSLTVNAATKTITVLQTSDLHGRIYPHDYALDSKDKDAGLAKIKVLVDKERAANPNTLLIDCGDTIQDNSAELFNNMAIHPMVSALNLLKYDTWTLGNHEFNFGLDFLTKNIKAFNGVVLAANIYKEGSNNRWVAPYHVFEKDSVRIAVVGLVPPAIPTWESSTPDHFKGLSFLDPITEINKVLKELKGKYDVLIGAFHIGPKGEYDYAGVKEIANKYPQFDVIFAGHAHAKFLEEVNGVKIIEAGKYGWALAKAEIVLEQKGSNFEITAVNTAHLETKKIQADKEMIKKFSFVHEQSVKDANLVVGKIAKDFIKSVDYITGAATVTTMPTSQMEDTAIIDLINDVQLYYTKAEVSSAALFNFGSNLKAGDFKKKDVAYIYKYPNTLVGVRITGENLKKYMEWSAAYYNTFTPGDLTISFNKEIRGYNYDMFSGINYEIDLSKKAGIRIKNISINGKKLNLKKEYKLAVNNYRFGTLMKLKLVTKDDQYYDSIAKITDIPDGRIRDLIIKYTKEIKKGTLEPTKDNNWKLVGFSIDKKLQEKAFALIRKGKLTVIKSEDGRTLNIKPIKTSDVK